MSRRLDHPCGDASFFGEAIDPFVVLGGVIILASVTFISWREATLQRRLRTPPVPATKV